MRQCRQEIVGSRKTRGRRAALKSGAQGYEAMQGREEQTIYRIRVREILDPCWSEWFDGMEVTPQEGGETLLTGPVRDQAALHGLLVKIRDMGILLLSVERTDASSAGTV